MLSGICLAAAFLLAVFVHESAHLAAIYSMGLRVERIGFELCGLKICYSGDAGGWEDLISALSGPVAGVVYYLFARNLHEMFALSAQISLVYSAFNLIPIIPLDGGRALSCLLEHLCGAEKGSRYCRAVSLVISVAVLLIGTIYYLRGEGGAVYAAGIWLVIMQNTN